MIRNSVGYKDMELGIRDFLNTCREIYRFEFCLVNMTEVERRVEDEDFCLLSILSEKETEYFEKLRSKKNRVQWVSGRYAVKTALYKYRFMDSSCTDILKGVNSAPFILQYPDLCVSITHSFPYCIGIVAKDKIGVDLERVCEPKESLLRHFYHQNERDILKGCKDTAEYSEKSILFWTRKEAASKLVRLGMKLDFNQLDTLNDRIWINHCGIQLKSLLFKEFCLSMAFEVREERPNVLH